VIRLLKPQWIETSRYQPMSDFERAELGLEPLPSAWSCNLADNRLTWSRGVFDLFGIAPGTRVDRRDIVEMYLGESRELMEQMRATAIATRGSFTMEAKICRADGSERWMLLTADVLCRNGRPTQLYGSKQDITAERALRDARRAG
jgi:PAS domain S-box-containing protein